MNSAPNSMGMGESGSCSVRMRPPIRSRASRHRTLHPARSSTRKAVSPAAPAPTMATSMSTVVLSYGPAREYGVQQYSFHPRRNHGCGYTEPAEPEKCTLPTNDAGADRLLGGYWEEARSPGRNPGGRGTGVLLRSRSERDDRLRGGRLPRTVRSVYEADADHPIHSPAGDRGSARDGNGCRLSISCKLRFGCCVGKCSVYYSRRADWPVLLDAHGSLKPRDRPQAGHGDAAYGRTDRGVCRSRLGLGQ